MKVIGKTVLITGAGSGIGQALVIALIKKGARVVAIDINEIGLGESKRLSGAVANNYKSYVLDITDRQAVTHIIGNIAFDFAFVDILINNAGIIQSSVGINELGINTAERIMAVNFTAAFNLIKVLLPFLLKRKEGHIVNIASMGTCAQVSGQSFYKASKAALAALSEGLTAELSGTNIGVSTIFPGSIKTNIAANSGLKKSELNFNRGKTKMTPPARAADLIIRAIEKGSPRLVIGSDAKSMDYRSRLNPLYEQKLIAQQLKGQPK